MALKILIQSTNWIGDAVMSTPAVTALAELYPDAEMTILARSGPASIFAGDPRVKEVIVRDLGDNMNRLLRPFSIARLIKARAFDMAVIFPNSFESALIPFLARIPRRIGYATDARAFLLTDSVPIPSDKETRHEVYYYLGLADYLRKKECLKAKAASRLPELVLNVPKEGEEGAKRIISSLGLEKAKLIGFNPGAAYGPAKCWPQGRFVALGRALVERHPESRILIFGTRKERSIAGDIQAGIGDAAYNLAGDTSLAEAMGIIRRLDLLVTNDSGLMHVGAALGVPLVAIFGSTNPVTTGPLSKKASVIQNKVDCGPCLKRTCPGGFECMQGIGVEEVLSVCEKWLRFREIAS
ncbi:MAG: lipopolysaccharide heptosyltransferase II [Dissulfurimicrobium sp.]|uniref:lipopolysaccharide heptosyltransferase II n=1 Tax=Dissulfurimicrobium sp. TaxID=2022436 RepID=UPI004049F3F2